MPSGRSKTSRRRSRQVSSAKVVFVGEAPAKAGFDPFDASRPGAGRRLASLLGIVPDDLHRQGWVFCNLFDVPVKVWNKKQAIKAAFSVCAKLWRSRPWVLVMLGRKVAEAFCDRRPFFQVDLSIDGNRAVVVPHPSGRCRVWNDKKNIVKFRRVMRQLGVLS